MISIKQRAGQRVDSPETAEYDIVDEDVSAESPNYFIDNGLSRTSLPSAHRHRATSSAGTDRISSTGCQVIHPSLERRRRTNTP